MKTKLRDCPWCGSPATLETDFGESWWVQCTNLNECGCTDGRLYEDASEAKLMWNRTPVSSVTHITVKDASYSDEPWQNAVLDDAEKDGWRYDGHGYWCAIKSTSELVTLYLSPQQSKPIHVLFKTEDKDAPDQIKDRNGEVVLSQCRHCGKGEVELNEPCNPPFQEDLSGDMKGVLNKSIQDSAELVHGGIAIHSAVESQLEGIRSSLVEEIASTPSGWSYTTHPAPTLVALAVIKRLLASAPLIHPAPLPHLYPLPSGGIAAEWSIGAWEASAEVNKTGTKVTLHAVNTDTAEEVNKVIDRQSPEPMSEFMSFMSFICTISSDEQTPD